MNIILVPYLNGIEPECEAGLKDLELAGIKVWRRFGSSQIDIARNQMASDALHCGFESIFFIDSDIGFKPTDVLKLINSSEPIICGIYAKKGIKSLTSQFFKGIEEVIFGETGRIYPLQYAATGFLRIKNHVLTKMIKELNLPLCDTKWGRGFWPFFQPIITNDLHYLGEDWAFSHRLHLIGVTPMADTTINLQHWGRFPYSVSGSIKVGESK